MERKGCETLDDSGKKLKIDQHDKRKDYQGKDKDVVVSGSDSVESQELEKQVGGDLGKITGSSMELERQDGQGMIDVQEISEVDISLREMVGKLKAVIDVRKKLSKSYRQRNLPFVSRKKEIDNYRKMVNELNREYDKTMQLYLNSIRNNDEDVNQSGETATEGKGKVAVVSGGNSVERQEFDKQVGGDLGNITGSSMELERQSGYVMTNVQEISEVKRCFKELVGKFTTAIDVTKNLSESLRQNNLPFLCREKEIDDYRKMVAELQREHDKTMQLYLNFICASRGSLQNVDSHGDDDAGVNQSGETVTGERAKM